MIVYRFEHSRITDPANGLGAGPYRASVYLNHSPRPRYIRDMFDAQDRLTRVSAKDMSVTPTPTYDEGIDKIFPEESCACTTRAGIIKWFGRAVIRKWVADYQFRVARYEVPDEHVRVGRSGQCVFTSSKAVYIDTEEV